MRHQPIKQLKPVPVYTICILGGEGGGSELLTCPYPLMVQTRPRRDQRLALRTKYRGSICTLVVRCYTGTRFRLLRIKPLGKQFYRFNNVCQWNMLSKGTIVCFEFTAK